MAVATGASGSTKSVMFDCATAEKRPSLPYPSPEARKGKEKSLFPIQSLKNW